MKKQRMMEIPSEYKVHIVVPVSRCEVMRAPLFLRESILINLAPSPSSTTQALISMVHKWAEATDRTGAAVRIDYRKAFDLIDHSILVDKIYSLRILRGVACWVCHFLENRQQSEKLLNNCFSEWGDSSSKRSKGTKLGPWLFFFFFNDKRPSSR